MNFQFNTRVPKAERKNTSVVKIMVILNQHKIRRSSTKLGFQNILERMPPNFGWLAVQENQGIQEVIAGITRSCGLGLLLKMSKTS